MEIFFKNIHIIMYLTAALYAFLTWNSISKYKKTHKGIQEKIDSCDICTAKIIEPTVRNGAYTNEMIAGTITLLSVFAGFPVNCYAYSGIVFSKVRYNVNGREITTVISRQASLRNLREGDNIEIYYEPLSVFNACAKDMEDILLKKPHRECFLNAIITIIMLLSGIFITLNIQS